MGALNRPSPILERLAYALAREFDFVIVRGNRALNQLRRRGLANVAILTGSVDLSDLDIDAPRKFDIAFVGRLTRIKRPDAFLNVVGKVRESIPEVSAVIIGSGPLEPSLRKKCAITGLTNQVTFLGSQDDVMEKLADARVFVLTSQSEGLSISMLEAMACGCVPVVPDIGELRDFVIDGETGRLAPPNDLETMAAQIVDTLRDESSRKRMMCAAWKAIADRATPDAVAKRWREMLSMESHERTSGQ
jgi:glycosyltransferase involved in cell wall biosynthesis